MIDALCHLELYTSLEVAHLACRAAKAAGVDEIVVAGTEPRAPELLPADTAGLVVHRAFGIHPMSVADDALPAQLAALDAKLDDERERAVAVGECGLDLRDGQPPVAAQERAFRAQLAVARRRGLPVILHLVRAHARALEILEEEQARHGALPAGGVWHAFAGPADAVRRGLRLGLSFSVGALVFNEGARRLREALPGIPLDRLLVETDAPHSALSTLPEHLGALAEVRGEDVDVVTAATAANARRAYRLPRRTP